MNARTEYWRECISEAAEECGAVLTHEQVIEIADIVEGAHENYGMAFGHDVADANLSATRRREVSDLKAQVEREQRKVHCRQCNGVGSITTQGPYHSGTSQCWKCSGDGRHDP